MFINILKEKNITQNNKNKLKFIDEQVGIVQEISKGDKNPKKMKLH